MKETIFPKLRVHIKDNNNSPHGKFHRFLSPLSSKFPDLNFAHMFSIFTHVMNPVGDTNSHLGLHVVKEEKLSKISLGSKVRLL